MCVRGTNPNGGWAKDNLIGKPKAVHASKAKEFIYCFSLCNQDFITSPKHSTTTAAMKKINSVPAKTSSGPEFPVPAFPASRREGAQTFVRQQWNRAALWETAEGCRGPCSRGPTPQNELQEEEGKPAAAALTDWMAPRRCSSFLSFLTMAPVSGQMK